MPNAPDTIAVGGLIYPMMCAHPDFAHLFGMVRLFLMNSGFRSYWIAVKMAFRYLKGTEKHGLTFYLHNCCEIVGFFDSHYASNGLNSKSRTNCVFTFGGIAVSSRSGLRSIVAWSTMEVKLIPIPRHGCVESVAKHKEFFQNLTVQTKKMCCTQAHYNNQVLYFKLFI